MDLESESVEDNDVSPERERERERESIAHVDEVIKIETNGSCANDIEDLSSGEGKDVEIEQPSSTTTSPVGSPPPKKGYGLKKWRRIRRDFIKDGGASVDSSKILKRGLSTSAANPTKPPHPSVEIKQKSEGFHGSSSDSRLAVGSAFAAGTDSENSEDRSSKSSTAASAPKLRHDVPLVLGYARDKNRMKNLSGKSLGNSVQRVQQGKSRIETSKKPRGERVKIEKENSHSSMESDSRSSNFVFVQGAFSGISNGKQSGRPMNYDGENSDEAQASEQQFNEGLRTGYGKENVGDVEDLSQDDLAADLSWDVKEEKSENHRPSTDRDPLVESILTLQSVQEALEKEVQKLGEIGKEPISVRDSSIPAEFTSINPEIHEPSSSDQVGSKEIRESASRSLESQVMSLTQDVSFLESKLEEARAMLEAKKSRVVELEATLDISKSPKEESGSTIELQQEKSSEMEAELEGIFKQRIEAEVEYLAITRTIQKLRGSAGDGISLFEEQETLAEEQAQMLNKLGDAESKAAMLKRQAEELETYCGDILGTEEVLKMQKRVCKFTSCFFIQLVLLVVVFGLFVLQLSPQSAVVAPT